MSSFRIKCNELIMALMLCLYVENYFFKAFGIAYDIIIAVISVFVMCYLLIDFKKYKLATLMMIYSVLLCFFTAINNINSIQYAIFYSLRLIGFIGLLEIVLAKTEYKVLQIFVYYVIAIIGINICFQILNPSFFGVALHSDNNINFFVTDNLLPYYYINIIAAISLYSWRKYNRISMIVYVAILMCFMSMLICFCGTGIIAFLIIIGLLTFYFLFSKILNIYTALIYMIVVPVSVYIFRIYIYFLDYFDIYLNKAGTFLSRVKIWENGLNYFNGKIFNGLGTDIGGRKQFMDIGNLEVSFYHIHSFILETFVQTSIIGVIILFVMYIYSMKRMDYCCKKTPIYYFLLVLLVSLFTAYLTEDWILQPMNYILLVCMCHIYSENESYCKRKQCN